MAEFVVFVNTVPWYSSFVDPADPILQSTAQGCSFIFGSGHSNCPIVNCTRATYDAIGPDETWIERLTIAN